eukprot:1901417-Pyramimonas_sp.AAC.1
MVTPVACRRSAVACHLLIGGSRPELQRETLHLAAPDLQLLRAATYRNGKAPRNRAQKEGCTEVLQVRRQCYRCADSITGGCTSRRVLRVAACCCFSSECAVSIASS